MTRDMAANEGPAEHRSAAGDETDSGKNGVAKGREATTARTRRRRTTGGYGYGYGEDEDEDVEEMRW